MILKHNLGIVFARTHCLIDPTSRIDLTSRLNAQQRTKTAL